MSMECYRHPGTTAKRKCFSCSRPICPECQITLSHHIFCGPDCHQKWKDEQEQNKKNLSPKPPSKKARELDNLRSELKDMADIVAAISHRVRSVEASGSDIDRKLFVLQSEIEKAGREGDETTTTPEGDMLDGLCSSLDEIRARLCEIETAHDSLRARLEKSSRPEADRALVRLDELVHKLSDLERRQSELISLAAEGGVSEELEERILNLEQSIASAASSVSVVSDADSTATAIDGLELAFERLKRMEAEQGELRDQIKKAHEDATTHTIRELDSIRNRLRHVEQSHRQLSSKALAPAPAEAKAARPPRIRLSLVVGLLVLFFLAAAMAGEVAFRKWPGARDIRAAIFGDPANGGGVADNNGGPAADESLPVPNIVYDDITPVLAAPTLDLGSEKISLQDSKADISGYAPGAVWAHLYLNNKEVASMQVRDQGFAFEQVSLNDGINVVQVKVSDESGGAAFSMASIIEKLKKNLARINTRLGINRQRGPKNLPYLALTIDAGSSNRRAEKILDVLKEKGITTTLFLTGQFIERYPDTVLRIVADGHEVGNHTYSHPHLSTFEKNRRHYTIAGMTRERFQEELLHTRKLFEDLTGVQMAPWWRAPYGEHNEEIRGWADEVGFKHVDWTRTPTNYDMLDWISDRNNRHYLNEDALYNRLTGIDSGRDGGANGGIILMHLGTDRHDDFPDQVLPRAIDELRRRGYQFVTVTRMFSE